MHTPHSQGCPGFEESCEARPLESCCQQPEGWQGASGVLSLAQGTSLLGHILAQLGGDPGITLGGSTSELEKPAVGLFWEDSHENLPGTWEGCEKQDNVFWKDPAWETPHTAATAERGVLSV